MHQPPSFSKKSFSCPNAQTPEPNKSYLLTLSQDETKISMSYKGCCFFRNIINLEKISFCEIGHSNNFYSSKKFENFFKMLEKNIIIQIMSRIQDYKNKLKMDELDEKEKKLSEFKLQKERLALQRAQASTEVQKQKEEVMQKFEKLSGF